METLPGRSLRVCVSIVYNCSVISQNLQHSSGSRGYSREPRAQVRIDRTLGETLAKPGKLQQEPSMPTGESQALQEFASESEFSVKGRSRSSTSSYTVLEKPMESSRIRSRILRIPEMRFAISKGLDDRRSRRGSEIDFKSFESLKQNLSGLSYNL